MPTTGVTRAWIQVLQGNWMQAFEYNRVFLLAPVLAISTYRYLLFEEKKDLTLAIVVALVFLINTLI